MAEQFVVTNVKGTTNWREKFFGPNLQQILRNALVAEAVATVDRSGDRLIKNPYINQTVVEITALTGTFTPTAWTTTNDTLTVGTEFKAGEHVFDFENVMSNYSMAKDRMDNQAYAIKYGIDKYCVNMLCEDGTGTYTTPAGGFTVGSNIAVIMSNLIAKVAGYQGVTQGWFLIIENTDLPGFLQAQVASGFSYADNALNNGFVTNYMGVDVYVVRAGTFENATYVGTDNTSITNVGHRVFGIKGLATYAEPQGITYEEISVSGKTGKECRSYGLFGWKLWAQNQSLIIDITLA
jgi:hypothetical protein